MPQHRGPERLSAADASNVVLDARDQVNVFLMAGLLGSGGFVAPDGRLDVAALRADLAARLGDPARDLGRFSQRVATGPGPLHWEDCEPDLAWHLRVVAPVGGRDGLAGLCAHLMTVPMPLDRPMWELLVVPGASTTGPGVVLRVHHAVADGVGGVRLVRRLFDDEPPAPPGVAPASSPRPSGRGRWRAFAGSAARILAVFGSSVSPTALLGPIGPRRGVAFCDVELPALALAARQRGATVNDALLAATAGAASATLRAAGEAVPAMLPASVPVALPERGSSGNAVGVMRIPLPTATPDVVARLTEIAAATTAAKAEARAQGTYEFTRTRWGSRLFAWLARRQRFIALFVTNVRGPDRPLLIAGSPLEYAWPVAPIQGNVRFGVAAMSYAGRLGVTVHVDAAALRADVARQALDEELDRIARSAG